MTAVRPPITVDPRPLNPDERRVLDLLLSQGFDGVTELRRQVHHSRVVAHCSCGCATVRIAVDPAESEPAVATPSPIPSEANVVDSAGEPRGGVIVFLRDGYLRSLEIYSFGDPIRTWPPPGQLKLTLRGS